MPAPGLVVIELRIEPEDEGLVTGPHPLDGQNIR
jgi:hypothetical protein